MRSYSSILFWALWLVVAHAAAAQDQREGDDFLKGGGLRLGEPLPDVSGFDLNGRPVKLRDFVGSYTVLVAGCMT